MVATRKLRYKQVTVLEREEGSAIPAGVCVTRCRQIIEFVDGVPVENPRSVLYVRVKDSRGITMVVVDGKSVTAYRRGHEKR